MEKIVKFSSIAFVVAMCLMGMGFAIEPGKMPSYVGMKAQESAQKTQAISDQAAYLERESGLGELPTYNSNPKLEGVSIPTYACGALSQSRGNYVLMNDVVSGQACFTVAADYVTLDCNGHRVTGGQDALFGLMSGKRFTKVVNCNFENFGGSAVYFNGAQGGEITNTQVAETENAVFIQGGSDFAISQSSFSTRWNSIVQLESSGLEIDSVAADSSHWDAIAVANAQQVHIKSSAFSSSQEQAAFIVNTHGVTIKDSYFESAENNGIGVESESSNVAIIGNKIISTLQKDAAIYANLVDGMEVGENYLVGGSGLIADGVGGGSVNNNYAQGPEIGIYIGGVSANGFEASGNDVSGKYGLYVRGMDGGSINRNRASGGNKGAALTLQDTVGNVVSENDLQNDGGAALKLQGTSNNNDFTSNAISNSGQTAAVDLGSSTGNTFESNTVGGSVIAASMQGGVFSGNSVAGTVSGLAFDSVSNTQFTGNTVSSSLGDAVVMKNGNNNNIAANELVSQSDTGAGLLLGGISQSTIERNTVSVKGSLPPGYGVALTASGQQGSTGNTVKENTITSTFGSAAVLLDSLSGGNAVYHNDITAGNARHIWIDSASATNVFFTVVNGFGQGNKYKTGRIAADDQYQIFDGNADGYADFGHVPFTSSNTNQLLGFASDPNPASRYCGASCQS